MRRFLLRIAAISALVSLLLLANILSLDAVGVTHAQSGGGCRPIGDPLVTETDNCTESMVMIGCGCRSGQWGLPDCDEIHFCIYTACAYPGGGFSINIFCT